MNRVNRQYLLEMGSATLLYVIAVFGAEPLHATGWPLAALLAPILGGSLMLTAIVRHFRRVDEMIRLVMAEAALYSLVALMLAGLTVGFMQIQNLLPNINAVWLAPTAAGAWGLFTVFVQRRYA